MKKKNSLKGVILQVAFIVVIFILGASFVTKLIDDYNLDYLAIASSTSCGDYQCAVKVNDSFEAEFLKFENNKLYFVYSGQIFVTNLAFTEVNEDAELYIQSLLSEGTKITVIPQYIANGEYVSYIKYKISNKEYFLQEVLLKKGLVKNINIYNLEETEDYKALSALSLDYKVSNEDIYGYEDDNQSSDEISLINSLDKTSDDTEAGDETTNENNSSDSSYSSSISDGLDSISSIFDNFDQATSEEVSNVTKLSASDVTTTVDACNLSGDRESNAVVDIGYDSTYATREYFAQTNEYGQLTYIYADEIIVQSDNNEDVTSSGRYCYDEAKVPGTESSTLDEGHGIADSLGGVSNAYNITPQNSTLNRSGAQYEMEDEIRNAIYDGGSVTEFSYNIEYSDTSTQTPSRYYGSYVLNGELVSFNFNNA